MGRRRLPAQARPGAPGPARPGQLHVRPARTRRGAGPPGRRCARRRDRDHSRGGHRGAAPRSGRAVPPGVGGGRPPGQPGQRLPPRCRSAHRRVARFGVGSHPGAPDRRGWRRRSRRRARPAGPRGHPRPGRNRVRALPRERRPAVGQERHGRSLVRIDGGHPGLQRAAGTGPRQRHGARPPRRPGGLPRDQQRHPAVARRRRGGGRSPAHEPLRGHGVPPGRGPTRGRGGGAPGVGCAAGEPPPGQGDVRVHATRHRARLPLAGPAAPERRWVDEPPSGRARRLGRGRAAGRPLRHLRESRRRPSPWRP